MCGTRSGVAMALRLWWAVFFVSVGQGGIVLCWFGEASGVVCGTRFRVEMVFRCWADFFCCARLVGEVGALSHGWHMKRSGSELFSFLRGEYSVLVINIQLRGKNLF